MEDQAYARTHLVKFLQQLEPGDRIAIYSMGSRLRLLHDFTDDTGALLRALSRHAGSTAYSLTAGKQVEPRVGGDPGGSVGGGLSMAVFEEFMREAEQESTAFFTISRTRQSLAVLEAIANRLAGVPRRKNLIWLSGGFPLRIGALNAGVAREQRDLSEEMLRAMRAINNANVCVYPVDARGLLGPMKTGLGADASTPGLVNSRSSSSPGSLINLQERILSQVRTDTADRAAAMNEIADRTGGQAFRSTNDIAGAIRKALLDAGTGYVLGYVPSHGQWDGRFREIKVEVKRPGLKVRHRMGYAAADSPPLDENRRRADLQRAAASPAGSSGLDMKVSIAGSGRPASAAGPIVVQVVLDLRQITVRQNGGRWEADVDLLFAVRGADGAALDTIHQPAALGLSREDYDRLLQSGIGLRAEFDLPPQAARIRVVARDAASAATGAVDIPIETPSPRGQGSKR